MVRLTHSAIQHRLPRVMRLRLTCQHVWVHRFAMDRRPNRSTEAVASHLHEFGRVVVPKPGPCTLSQ